MDLDVLHYYPRSTGYYILHPWVFFKDFFCNHKAAKQRATMGFCYGDVWDMDEWFCTIIPQMLRIMAEKGSAYPGDDKFDTPEKWHDWLNGMADVFEASNVEDDEENEFAKEFFNMKPKDPKYEEMKTLYFERAKEIANQKKAMRASAMKAFSEGIIEGILWD